MSKINFKFNFGSTKAVEVKMRKATEEKMRQFFVLATREFIDGVLDDVASGAKYKIETGMSMASLIPLATKVQYAMETRQQIKQGRRLFFRKGLVTQRGEWRPGGERNMSAGIAAGENAYSFDETFGDGNFKLSYRTTVYQHERWEGKNESLAKGRAAMLVYINEHKDELKADIGRIYRRITGSYFRGN